MSNNEEHVYWSKTAKEWNSEDYSVEYLDDYGKVLKDIPQHYLSLSVRFEEDVGGDHVCSSGFLDVLFNKNGNDFANYVSQLFPEKPVSLEVCNLCLDLLKQEKERLSKPSRLGMDEIGVMISIDKKQQLEYRVFRHHRPVMIYDNNVPERIPPYLFRFFHVVRIIPK